MAHEVTNLGGDRTWLAYMDRRIRDAIGAEHLTVLADRGYLPRAEMLACQEAGITPSCPGPLTSGSKPGWGGRRGTIKDWMGRSHFKT